jgi:hypothetical protein
VPEHDVWGFKPQCHQNNKGLPKAKTSTILKLKWQINVSTKKQANVYEGLCGT